MAYVKLKNLFAIEPIWDPSDRWVYIFELTNENYTSDTVDNIPTEAYNPKVGDVVTLTVYFGGYYFTEPTPEEIENWKNTRFKEPYEIGTAMTLKKVIGSISGNTIKLSDNSYGEYEFKRFGELTNDDYTSYNKYISNIEIDGENYLIKDSSIEEQLTNKVDINSKVIDGQWVKSYIELAKNTQLPVTSEITYIEYDISSYLPIDNYKYEILVTASMATANINGSLLETWIGSLIDNSNDFAWLNFGKVVTRTAAFCFDANSIIIPVNKHRKIRFIYHAREGGVCQLSTLSLQGYRRLGTNE